MNLWYQFERDLSWLLYLEISMVMEWKLDKEIWYNDMPNIRNWFLVPVKSVCFQFTCFSLFTDYWCNNQNVLVPRISLTCFHNTVEPHYTEDLGTMKIIIRFLIERVSTGHLISPRILSPASPRILLLRDVFLLSDKICGDAGSCEWTCKMRWTRTSRIIRSQIRSRAHCLMGM